MFPGKLQQYVLRELLYVAVLSLIALTSIIFVGMSASLVQGGLSVIQLADVIPYVVALSLPYALPSALLLASVFVFGRLGAQNELSAMRSSGVNLNYIIFPALAIGLLVSIGSFGLNHYLLPWSVTRVSQMRNQIIAHAAGQVGRKPDERYELGDYTMYIGGVDAASKLWKNVALIQFSGDVPAKVLIAQRAACTVDEGKSVAKVTLYTGTVIQPRLSTGETRPPIGFKTMALEMDLTRQSKTTLDKPGFMTLTELIAAIDNRRAAVAKLRQEEPGYAQIKHPRGPRLITDAAQKKLYREINSLVAIRDDRQKQYDKAHTALDQAQGALASARTARDAAAQRQKEIEKELTELKPIYEQALADLRPPAGEKVSKDPVQQEVARLGDRVKQLTTRLADANLEAARTAQALDLCTQQVEERTRDWTREQAALAAAQKEVQALTDTYDSGRSKVANLRTLESRYRAETEFHFRNAGALTCFVFMLVGIPLGIISRHGNIITAFVISFSLLLVVYYPLTAIMNMLAQDGYLWPWLLQWFPNTMIAILGAVLLVAGVRR